MPEETRGGKAGLHSSSAQLITITLTNFLNPNRQAAERIPQHAALWQPDKACVTRVVYTIRVLSMCWNVLRLGILKRNSYRCTDRLINEPLDM